MCFFFIESGLLTHKALRNRLQNLRPQNFWKCFIQTLSYWDFKHKRASSVDSDEAAHYEPPHLDLPCLQVQLFSFQLLLGIIMTPFLNVNFRQMQEVYLDKHIRLLDSPGVVMATGTSDTSIILKNCVRVSDIETD